MTRTRGPSLSSVSPAPVERFRSAREAEAYLLSLINYEIQTDYRPTTRTHDLDRFRRLLLHMGWRPEAVPTVHVGGTNGKGSVAMMIEKVLRAAGLRTGLFTSPHLHQMRERVMLSGRPLTADRFRELVSRLARVFPSRPGAGFRTTFENLTAVALLGFQEGSVERAVVEVGLGGKLDATNVIAPGPAVITPVSRDHVRILGRRVGDIAADKAHILKRGGSGFLMPQSTPARRALVSRLAEFSIPWSETRRAVSMQLVAAGEEGSSWAIRGEEDYGTVPTCLLGSHQGDNLGAAVAVAETVLPPHKRLSAVRGAFRGLALPGRLERVNHGGQRYLLDGAHNPAAARVAARAVSLHFPKRRVVAVVGMARDKDHHQFLAALEPSVGRFVFTASANPRAASPRVLAGKTDRRSRTAPNIEAALDAATRDQPDLVLVTGSFLLVAEARAVLGRRTVRF